MANFTQYKDWRDRYIKMIDEVISASEPLAPEKAKLYSMLRDQLREDTLKIQVVGTVKNGKSSFTNAMIGEKILPVDDIPCTAVVSEVKYAPQKKAIITFYSPTPTGLLDEIPKETKDYIVKNNCGLGSDGKPKPIKPLEVPYDKLNEYVAIPEPTEDILFDEEKYKAYRTKIDQESPFDVAQLFHPAAVLSDGVELVDSPGLNESPKRTAVTLDYLKKADAAIYLLDATHPFVLEERRVIEQVLLPLGFTDLIMVANRIDLVENRRRQVTYIQGNAMEYTSIKKVFGVSAKQALNALAKSDKEELKESGMPEFMDFLMSHLSRKKGQMKLNKTARQIVNSVKTDLLENLIPGRLSALDASSIELKKRVNAARPKLTKLEADRQKLVLEFDQKIPLALIPIQRAIESFFNKLQDQIRDWVWTFKPTDKSYYLNKKDLENISGQILEHIQKKVEEAYNKWNEQTFQPLLLEQANMVFGNTKEDIENLAAEISAIEGLLKGVGKDGVKQSSTLERIAGVATMILLPVGNAGGELFSGGFDFQRFMKSFAIDLGLSLGVGLIALWVFPPAGVIAMILGPIIGMLVGTDKKIDELKGKLIAEVCNGLKNSAPERIRNISEEIRKTFDNVKNSVVEGVDSQIETVRNQIAEIERITNNEQESLDAKRKQLLLTQGRLSQAIGEMEKLTTEIDRVAEEATAATV